VQRARRREVARVARDVHGEELARARVRGPP
jgi:hypothetical protein